MKRFLAVLALCLTLLAQAGCWSRIEVNDIAMVGMLGLDRTGAGEIQAWLTVIDPRGRGVGGGQGKPGAGAPTVVYTGTGPSVQGATREIQRKVSRRLFWAHLRVIMIGEALAEEGVRPVLDFLTRHLGVRLTSYIVLTDAEPQALFTRAMPMEGLANEYLRELEGSQGAKVMLGDYVSALAAAGAAPYMGRVRAVPPDQAGEVVFRTSGVAVFQEDRLAGLLDQDETTALLWVRDKWQRTGAEVVGVQTDLGTVTLSWVRSRIRRRAYLEAGRVVVGLELDLRGALSEVPPEVDVTDEAAIERVERAVGAVVRERVLALVERLQTLGVDATGYGRQVEMDLPWDWPRLKPRWEKEFPRVRTALQVRVEIERAGLSTKSRAARPKEE